MTNISHRLTRIIFTSLLYAGLVAIVISSLPLMVNYKARQRAALLRDFLEQVQESHQFDPAKLIELRERYSPGSITFDPAVIHISFMPVFRQPFVNPPFLIYRYTAPYVVATERVIAGPASVSAQRMLTDKLLMASPSALTADEIIYQDTDSLIQINAAGNLLVTFLRPAEQLRQYVGVVDYVDKVRNYLQGKYWLSQTEFGVSQKFEFSREMGAAEQVWQN